jgi:hypothetical protein
MAHAAHAARVPTERPGVAARARGDAGVIVATVSVSRLAAIRQVMAPPRRVPHTERPGVAAWARGDDAWP